MMKNEYDANVWYPTTPEDIAEATEVFTRAGFPGCIASIDGVHFAYEGYASQDRHFFVGKERYPCVGVNVAVDYHGRAMHVSRLHRGGDPDITMAAEDAFLQSLDEDDVFRDFEFFLTSLDGRVGVKGVYTVGDNGYPKWRTIVSIQAPGTWLRHGEVVQGPGVPPEERGVFLRKAETAVHGARE